MANDKRRASRTMPAYDPDNNIGAVDRIRFAIINNMMDKLTKDELVQLGRWRQIDDWIRSRRYIEYNALESKNEEKVIPNQRFIRNLAMAKFEITWDTAERDILNTQKLFNSRDSQDKEYYRWVYIEQAEQRAEEAAARGNDNAAVKYLELAANLRKLFDQDAPEQDQDKLQALQFIIEYNPEAVGLKTIENKDEVYAKWMQKKVLDRMAKDAEEATYVP